jgi:FkbH-like protein
MESMLERARQLDPLALSSVEVHRLSREMRRANLGPEARIAFAGNIVFQPLPEFLEAHLFCHGINATSYVAGFDQSLQELLDERSALHRFDPNFLLLHFELDSLLPAAVRQRGERANRTAIHAVMATIEPVVRAALTHTSAAVLLTNFAGPDCYDLGLADARLEFGEQEFYAQLNSSLVKAFREEPRVQLVDLCRLTAFHGRGRARDRRLYYLAKLPWHESFLPVLADEMARHIGATLGRLRKCLVVDLDDTLWGGILGEDGPLGVRVGSGDPVAEAHFDLQRRILAIKHRGVLLAICSKNNPAEVENVFRVRPEMPLRREDFACMEIGWAPKHEGLRRIADKLDIGADSLVFLDDNPAEIELIRQMLPEVECVLLPPDPALRPACLDRVHSLDRVVLTAEDASKTEQYAQKAARSAARSEFSNLKAYLHSLNTRVEIRPGGSDLLARAHQLFSKTNQFNVTTQRLSLAELQSAQSDPSCRLLMVHAEDRFGDLGWIGVVLLRDLDQSNARIDSFLLSCRAMGRGIETAVLNHAKQVCFRDFGCASLLAEYRPTSRNAPARELFETHGFTLVRTDENGSKHYRLDREASSVTPCDWIEVAETSTVFPAPTSSAS